MKTSHIKLISVAILSLVFMEMLNPEWMVRQSVAVALGGLIVSTILAYVVVASTDTLRWRWCYSGEDMLEMIADEAPDRGRVQLLRGLSNPTLKQGRDAHQCCPRHLEMGV